MTNSDQRLIDNFFEILRAMFIEPQNLEKEMLKHLQQQAPKSFVPSLSHEFRKAVNRQIFWTREHYKNKNQHLNNRINQLSSTAEKNQQQFQLTDDEKREKFKAYIRNGKFISIPVTLIKSNGETYFEDLSTCLTHFLQETITLEQIMDDQKWLEIKKILEEHKVKEPLDFSKGSTDLTPGRFMPFLQKDEKDFAALVHDAEREVSPQEEVPHLSSQRCSVSVR